MTTKQDQLICKYNPFVISVQKHEMKSKGNQNNCKQFINSLNVQYSCAINPSFEGLHTIELWCSDHFLSNNHKTVHFLPTVAVVVGKGH